MKDKYLPSRSSSWPSLLLWFACPLFFLIAVMLFLPTLIVPAAIALAIGLIACLISILFDALIWGLSTLWLCAFTIFIWIFFI